MTTENKSNRKTAMLTAKAAAAKPAAVKTVAAAKPIARPGRAGASAAGMTDAVAAAPAKPSKTITKIAAANDGHYTLALTTGMPTLSWRNDRQTPAIIKAAKVGASYAALEAAIKDANAHKPEAKLAKGAEKEVHSKAAAAASRASAQPAKVAKAAAPAKAAAKAKTEARKETVAKATGKVDAKYTKGPKVCEAKSGSWREYMLATTLANKSTAAAIAAHVVSGQFSDKKLDFGWMNREGYIVIA